MFVKKYKDVETDELYYVGATSDIKAIYKSIRRNKCTNLCPMFCESPKFSELKTTYALCISDNYITIINSDTMLSMIIDELVEEV